MTHVTLQLHTERIAMALCVEQIGIECATSGDVIIDVIDDGTFPMLPIPKVLHIRKPLSLCIDAWSYALH